MIVKVKSVPVRYNGQTYSPDEEFEMDKAHLNENIVDVVEDDDDDPKTIEEMTIAELKKHAKENEIDLGDAKKQKEILSVIQATEEKTPADPKDPEDKTPEATQE
jgi:hypothetical protein